MISAYISSAHDGIRSTVANMDGTSVPLLSLIIPPAYHAACRAAFGPGFPAEESYPLFKAFDDSFHLLATTIPRIFLSKPLKAWDKLVDLIEAYIGSLGDDLEEAGHFVKVAIRGREAGWVRRGELRSGSLILTRRGNYTDEPRHCGCSGHATLGITSQCHMCCLLARRPPTSTEGGPRPSDRGDRHCS